MSFINFNTNLQNNKKSLLTAITNSQKHIQELLQIEPKTYYNFVKPYFESSLDVEYFFTMISHINSVKNTKESQEIYTEVLPVIDEYSIDLSTNEEIYQAFVAVSESSEALTNVQKKALEDTILAFRLSGVALPADKKEELKKIKMRLSELSNDFSQNLLDANNEYELIITDYEDVKELPKADLEQSKCEVDGKTAYKFTLQMPSYVAYITYGSNPKYREQLYKAYVSRAPQNAKLIDETLLLREKEAKLLGFDNYASLSIAHKDAPSVQSVEDFLVQIAQKAKQVASKELTELREFAKNEHQASELNAYDTAYYSEKMKLKYYHIDEEQYMDYFKKNDVVDFVLRFLEESFGASIVEAKSVEIWDPSVKVYDFYTDEKCFARLYLDLENNQGKRGGAWMNDFQTHFVDAKGKTHLGSAFVVCNFMPSSKTQPSLLRHSDIVTLFHELGHATHHIFSQVSELSLSGVNGVDWDVIEFPSQFLEQFAYDKEVLKSIGKHYETGEVISDEMVNKLIEAKNFLAGMQMVRQCEFSLFDVLLHKKLHQGEEVQALLDGIREKYAVLVPPSYNKFQNGFSHIFSGGYACGYYSYKWAEVLSADLYLENKKRPIMNEYKEHILEKGASEKMGDLLENIIHRKPSIDALFELYGLGE